MGRTSMSENPFHSVFEQSIIPAVFFEHAMRDLLRRAKMGQRETFRVSKNTCFSNNVIDSLSIVPGKIKNIDGGIRAKYYALSSTTR